jgi:hypothetical protein
MDRFWDMIFLSFKISLHWKVFLPIMDLSNKYIKNKNQCSKIMNIDNFLFEKGQNVRSQVCGVWPAQKCPRARTFATHPLANSNFVHLYEDWMILERANFKMKQQGEIVFRLAVLFLFAFTRFYKFISLLEISIIVQTMLGHQHLSTIIM